MKKISNQMSIGLVAVALGGTALLGGSALAVSVPVEENPLPRAAGSYTSFAPVVKKVTPGVVKVDVTTKSSAMA
jgi:S1-C subfamily serine protease